MVQKLFKLSIKISSLILLGDQQKEWQRKKDAGSQNIVEPLGTHLEMASFWCKYIERTYIWNLENEKKDNSEHVEPEGEPGSCEGKNVQGASYNAIKDSPIDPSAIG